MRHIFIALSAIIAAIMPLWPNEAAAHSGKARFHVIIDTDCAADDLRTICMLLGNREVEVLAITTSDGAVAPRESARRVAALLDGFHHQGIPVGAGRETLATAPEWRGRSERIEWGSLAATERASYPTAPELIAETIAGEPERVVIIALGALTNIGDALSQDPALADRIERIVWYNDTVLPPAGANYDADPAAAEKVLESGVEVAVISAGGRPLPVTPRLIDSVATVGTPYARKIIESHRMPPLSQLVADGHLKLWDDLTAVYLFRPECFTALGIDGGITYCIPSDEFADETAAAVKAVLSGKPDSESRVFYGFPTDGGLYAQDVMPIIDKAIRRHGPSEWRAAVLTNELHGHLGIYATIGVKMGIRAREYFDIGVDDIEVTTYAGSTPPVSCMNDGLQVGTGASIGHGLITVVPNVPPRPEARFRFKNKSIRLALKPEYAQRIRDDVKRGVETYGDLTEPYWQYVRALALKYWLEFDRHEIFDMYVEN